MKNPLLTSYSMVKETEDLSSKISSNKTRISTFMTSIQHCIGVVARAIKQEKLKGTKLIK